jgi:multimeric flavodoxin WrbA
MKLMAIIGSPRKGGNTEFLIDQVVAGFKSTTDTEVEKIFIIDRRVEYCTGCLSCVFPSPGKGECVIDDDMTLVLESMKRSDAFIFGTPNHMRTVTAPLLNFLARMLPLLVFDVYYDEQGNRVGGEMSSNIGGKKAAMVISQGEPYFCSSLVYEVLENNLNDFRLQRVGNIISMNNTEKGDAAAREEDRKRAFELGVALATSVVHSKSR